MSLLDDISFGLSLVVSLNKLVLIERDGDYVWSVVLVINMEEFQTLKKFLRLLAYNQWQLGHH